MELRIYTIDEAAEALKLNKFTLYRYIKSGKLKASTSENLSGGQEVRSE